MNSLEQLAEHGQAVWYDYIRRALIVEGDLARMIERDGLRGVTSNPSIFEKAIAGSADYESTITDLAADSSRSQLDIYETIAVEDVRRAADVFTPVHESTDGVDGYVSLEVSPRVAADAEATCAEARRLWRALDRPNVMIKVPGTSAGLHAIEQLTFEGINVNVTLLFSRDTYARVIEAYLRGLERRADEGLPVDTIASVASFFVSRIDVAVGRILDERLASGSDGMERHALDDLRSEVGVANARLAYVQFTDTVAGDRWRRVADLGARPQRLLWASTSTKSPDLSDVHYVERLIGPDTVNTLAPSTYEAFRDHGSVRPTLGGPTEEAERILARLADAGISLEGVADRLLQEGLVAFGAAHDKVLAAIQEARERGCRPLATTSSARLPADLESAVDRTLDAWSRDRTVRRIWDRDPTLWTGSDESQWLGWLSVAADQLDNVTRFAAIGRTMQEQGFEDAVVLGMGGSSLCPDVLGTTWGRLGDSPRLQVLDSTDPAQVRSVRDGVALDRTLFIVSSKSGTTLETRIAMDYFLAEMRSAVGEDLAGSHFVAVTDPGSDLQEAARTAGFRATYLGVPSIGGRYSALSDFGMVPAAIMGLDVERLLERADRMAEACAPCVPTRENPGVLLGTVLGTAARAGRDKVTFIVSPAIDSVGAWLEQLLAESTGKQGRGLIPSVGERPGEPGDYGADRIFVYLRLGDAADESQDQAVIRLADAGQPVVRIDLDDRFDLAREFFRWEFATAVAGAVLEIDPFNQPDVEASKVATREITREYERRGSLPREAAFLVDDRLKLYADGPNSDALIELAGPDPTVEAAVAAHVSRLEAGDYLAVLAYLEMSDAHRRPLERLRHAVRDAYRVATCVQFGPRFLHSTGQAYKGGPNTGVFLQITCDDAIDVQVPGRDYSFGIVKAAQARGDYRVLAERRRRALRVHLGEDVAAGLDALCAIVERAARAAA